MDGCKRAFYTAQGDLHCIETFSEGFEGEPSQDPAENCSPTCPVGKSMLNGTTMCYANAKVKPMNTCMDKLPVKPPPSPMGPFITQQQTNLYNALYASENKKCQTKYWKPVPPGTDANETCITMS